MKIDKYGIPCFDTDDIVDMMLDGDIDAIFDVLCNDEKDLQLFNNMNTGRTLAPYTELSVDISEFDHVLQNNIFLPEYYKNISVYDFLLNKTKCEIHLDRLNQEFDAFEQRNLMGVLRFLIYLVDVLRENNIIWGVGRGSSVSSYILFLIGIHRIDPIKHNLDWKEFLR